MLSLKKTVKRTKNINLSKKSCSIRFSKVSLLSNGNAFKFSQTRKNFSQKTDKLKKSVVGLNHNHFPKTISRKVFENGIFKNNFNYNNNISLKNGNFGKLSIQTYRQFTLTKIETLQRIRPASLFQNPTPSTSKKPTLLFHSNNNLLLSTSLSSPKKISSSAQPSTPPFTKILIANRGEIACRIIKSCKKMGIKTVAIYSNVDANCMHVTLADEAICVGEARSDESYLLAEKIVDACRKTGAQAVHPGYGFLSEKADFAELLEKNNIVFIGPDSQAIHAMGDKIESKKIAQKAGVNVIPGKLSEISEISEVLSQCNEIGYPVMLKASAGGGGKGMRIAWNDEEAKEGFRLAKQEAMSSFKDDRLLIEKYIDEPRHIEIQILADSFGNTIYLNERECSIQRRNQKVLEEAPSSFLDPETRKKMGEQAVQLAKAVGYKSAGTVEFLVDKNKNFYFLEMNTRLQVEHPVTEFITRVDLVKLMIDIAAGKKLELKQEDIKIHGWATEARVYAEDPLRGFLPSIGHLDFYREIGNGRRGTFRFDSGVSEGDDISIYYDPLISKTIGMGKTRQESIFNLSEALDTYIIRGPNHNINFLRDVLENKRYIEGNITTKFIPEEYPHGFKGHILNETEKQQLASSAAAMALIRLARDGSIAQNEDFEISNQQHYFITIQDPLKSLEDIEIELRIRRVSHEQQFQVEIFETNNEKGIGSSKVLNVSSQWPVDSFIFPVNIEDNALIIQYIKNIPHGMCLQFKGTKYNCHIKSPKEHTLFKHMLPSDTIDSTKYLLSPMPGQIISINPKIGDIVQVGNELCLMEAMKMQNVLRSQNEVVVKNIFVKKGQKVDLEEALMEFRPTVLNAGIAFKKSFELKDKKIVKETRDILKDALIHQAFLANEFGLPKSSDDQMKKEFKDSALILQNISNLEDDQFDTQFVNDFQKIMLADSDITDLLLKVNK